jgi:hypothetical protein
VKQSIDWNEAKATKELSLGELFGFRARKSNFLFEISFHSIYTIAPFIDREAIIALLFHVTNR